MRVQWGCAAPYDVTDDKPYTGGDPARMAVLGVLDDLCDRRGIRHPLGDLDPQVRVEIVESLAEIVRAAFDMADQGNQAEVKAEHDARFIAGLAADIHPHSLDGKAVYPGTPEADQQQVRRAMALLAESRRQVAAERGSA